MNERLSALGDRIELLATDPAKVRAPFTRLFRPVLRGLGWRPKLVTEAVSALLVRVGKPGDADGVETLLDKAIAELDDNVGAVERAFVLNGRVGTAQAAWLRRLYEVVARADRAVESGDAIDRRIAGSVDRARILPPLEVRPREDQGEAAPEDASAARLVELQLASIDHLLEAARDERSFLARRRRLLEAARELLLDSAAALPLDADAVEARRAHLGREIVRIDRLQAAGVDPDVALLHQARSALSRGERGRLHSVLVAIDDGAAAVDDGDVARRTRSAIDTLWKNSDRTDAKLRSLVLSAGESLGGDVVEKIKQGVGGAESDAVQTYAAALAVDGAFEVGGTLSPVRVTEIETRARAVPWPTQDMQLAQARGIEDVPNAILDDPRTIMLSLATGRLLTRRYIQEDRIERKRTKLIGEVRVYLLDGSSSMYGARAKVRDALLVSELATLAHRWDAARSKIRVTLFYRYFDTQVHAVTRIADGAAALAKIPELLSTPHEGGTNIEAALIASLDQVREARASDPDLARAQIVLVTDGQSAIEEAAIERARRGMDDVAIAVSVIALGEENAALRSIVAAQRKRGERAFYHYIPDASLVDMVCGNVDVGTPIHLPEVEADRKRGPTETARVLQAELGTLVDELFDLDRARDLEAMERTEAELRASADMGIELDGEAARREALARDLRAIERRFARWFPEPVSDKGAGKGDDVEGEDVDAAYVVLATVAEVVTTVGGSTLARRAEAIDTLERLLPDAGLTPARYLQAVRATSLEKALVAVRSSVAPPKV